MKEQTNEQLLTQLAELRAENARIRNKVDPFFNRVELSEGVYGEISADDVGNWYPTIEFESQGMQIRISNDQAYPNRTKAIHACADMYAEYADLCEGTIKAYLSPETLNTQVHPTMRPFVNSLAQNG